MSPRLDLSRRRLLQTTGSATLITAASGILSPYISRAADRPQITHGVQSGDVSADSGMVWARSDRPSRIMIEYATTDSFKDVKGGAYADAMPESDFTAKVMIENLPAGQDIFYRLRFLDHSAPTIGSEPLGISRPRLLTGAPSAFAGPAIRRGKAGALIWRAAA